MRFSLIFTAFVLVTSAPCAAQTVVPEGQSTEAFTDAANAALLHRASGYAFPTILGDMPRRKKVLYAPDDVSVQYTLRGGGFGDAWIDLYVYPAPRSVEAEAKIVEGELLRNLNAKPLASQPLPPVTAVGALSGWFRGTIKNRGMTSGYIIVRRGDWYILARATSPDEAGQKGMDRLAAALAAVDWSWAGYEVQPAKKASAR